MTDGNSDEAARGRGGDEEAAWLDLIGRFEAAGGSPGAPAPWPDRENLAPPAAAGEDLPGPGLGPADGLGDWAGLGEPGLDERLDEPGLDEPGLGEHGLGEHDLGEGGLSGAGQWPPADDDGRWPPADADGRWPQADADGRWPPADTDGAATGQSARWPTAGDSGQRPPADADGRWPQADTDGAATGRSARWPTAGDAAAAGEDAAGDGPAGTGLLPGAGPGPDGRFVLPGHRPLGMPSPAAPRSWHPPDEDDEDEHYTPPPPPPLPTLAPGTKAAWVGLFGGPGYLLIATLAGWSVPGWALFLAIAAFVGGFTVLVLRQSDRPDEDSGPDDDGAVV